MSDAMQAPLEGERDTMALAENIGLNIAQAKVDEIMNYLGPEVAKVLEDSDRGTMMETIDRIKKDRLGIPDSATKDTPWPGASNVKPPVTLQKVLTIYAKVVNNLFADEKLFWGKALDSALCDDTEVFTRWFNQMVLSPTGMNIKSKLKDPIYDIISIGSGVVRVPWIREEVTVKGVDGTEFVQVRKLGPQLEYVPLGDFATRAHWSNIQGSPYIAALHRLTLADLRLQVRRGFFDAAKVGEISGATSELGEHQTSDAELQGLSPKAELVGHADGNFDIVEAWVLWDAETDGVMNECKIFYEKSTETVLRAEFNPLGHREVVFGKYLAIPSQLYGIGVGHICLSSQAEITAMHNAIINATQLQLSPIFKYRIGSQIGKDTKLYPGKGLGVDDMGDLDWMVAPDVATTARQMELMALQYADQATGASQILTGQSDATLKSGGGAQANYFLAQQSSSILNAVQANIQEFVSEIGQLALEQCVLHKDEIDLSQLSPEDQAAVKRVLEIPLEMLPNRIKFTVELADLDKSDQAELQKATQAFQVYTQYFQLLSGIEQIIGMSGGTGQPAIPGQPPAPQIPENVKLFALQSKVSLTLLMRQMFEDIGIPYVDRYFPSVKMETKALQDLDAMKDAKVKSALEGGANGGFGAPGGMPGGAPGPEVGVPGGGYGGLTAPAGGTQSPGFGIGPGEGAV